MKTWITFTASLAFFASTLNVCPIVNGQDDLPPCPRIDSVRPSSVPVDQVRSTETSNPQTDSTPAKASKPKSDSVEPKKFDLSFEDLKFEMEKGGDFDRTMLTEKINSYHGGIISIRGYIKPVNKQSGITKFVFVRDDKECCFGPGAALYDCVLVRLEKGHETEYTVRPITIEGKFALKEYRVDGKAWSIYRMTDAKVK